MAPKFGLDIGFNSNFDATLVLATMLQSQLSEHIPPEAPTPANIQAENEGGSHAQGKKSGANVSDNPSDTRVWSDLSGEHFL